MGHRQTSSFSLQRRLDEGRASYVLRGVIDELATLEGIDRAAPLIELDLEGIERINSFGARDFFRLMRELSDSEVLLHRCSVVVIEQANLIADFFGGAKILSFHLPMICSTCSETFSMLTETDRYLREGLPSPACPSCGCPAELDDDADYYFAFLRARRQGS